MTNQNYLLTAVREELGALKELFLENKSLVILILTLFLGSLYFVDPFPERSIQMAITGRDSGYAIIAANQERFLAANSISLKVETTKNSAESAKLLVTPNSGVSAALIQGGVLGTDVDNQILSLGSVAFEPVWIFYRKNLENRIDRFKDFANLQVGVGPNNSGTKAIAKKLFELNGVDIDRSSNFHSDSYENNLREFLDGKLDALINVNPEIDPIVNRLLHEPNAGIYELKHAAAYDKYLPFVKVVTLPAASVDIAKQIPPKDIAMLATTTNLVVNKDMHPSLQIMLLIAAKDAQRVAQSLFLSNEEKFPAYLDPSIPISSAASQFYDYGVPQTMRYLPFWLAGFIDRTWIYILSLFAILYPLSYLNLNLRSIRFRMRMERVQRELLDIARMLEDSANNDEKRAAILKRLENILITETKFRVPLGSEGEYLDFLSQIHEMHARAK